MHAQQQVIQALQEVLPALKRKYPIARVALFGSVTRDDFDPEKSDVDIMIEFSDDIGYEFVELANELEQSLGKKIDLVSRAAFKPRHWEYLKNKMRYV